MRARKAIVLVDGIGTLSLIFTIFAHSLILITVLFAIAKFTYQGFSVVANVLPSDLYRPGGVASVSGLSGAAAGFGTILGFKAIGYFTDCAVGSHAFDPIMIACGLIPFIGALLVIWLIQAQRSPSRALQSIA